MYVTSAFQPLAPMPDSQAASLLAIAVRAGRGLLPNTRFCIYPLELMISDNHPDTKEPQLRISLFRVGDVPHDVEGWLQATGGYLFVSASTWQIALQMVR